MGIGFRGKLYRYEIDLNSSFLHIVLGAFACVVFVWVVDIDLWIQVYGIPHVIIGRRMS